MPQKQVLAAADEGSVFCLACPLGKHLKLSALNLVRIPNNPQTIEKAWSETSKWQKKSEPYNVYIYNIFYISIITYVYIYINIQYPGFFPPPTKTSVIFIIPGFPLHNRPPQRWHLHPTFPLSWSPPRAAKPQSSVPWFFCSPPKKNSLGKCEKHAKTHLMLVEVQSFCFREVFFFVLNSVFFLVCICFGVCLMMVSDLSSFHVAFIS